MNYFHHSMTNVHCISMMKCSLYFMSLCDDENFIHDYALRVKWKEICFELFKFFMTLKRFFVTCQYEVWTTFYWRFYVQRRLSNVFSWQFFVVIQTIAISRNVVIVVFDIVTTSRWRFIRFNCEFDECVDNLF